MADGDWYVRKWNGGYDIQWGAGFCVLDDIEIVDTICRVLPPYRKHIGNYGGGDHSIAQDRVALLLAAPKLLALLEQALIAPTDEWRENATAVIAEAKNLK